MLKQTLKILTVLLFTFLIAKTSALAETLYWFTGAAVKKPTLEIADMFNKTRKNKVIVIAGGTGQVLQQMILSNKGDVYGCMDPKFFQIAKSKGLVVKYKKFLKLIPVFGVSEKAKDKIHTFYDLFKNDIKIAAGNPKTMALGKTYLFILNRLPENLRERMKQNVKIEAVNISQIINYIKMGIVDAGILFRATAKVNHIKYVNIPSEYNKIKTAYLAEMVFGKNKKAKDELFNFILKHLYVFEKYGYKVILQ
ncbi:substrate-binding domain-containing protein [Hippea alviniae]|uniref:substrate-binding domain-containing protein n=1 Tax=Hippea alviniae TaxID=1279027 RepID=UPI0003B717DC|nr:substrate-binding domain-containing protein [Hippea alviniae]